MRGLNIFCLLAFLCVSNKLFSQVVYSIQADSVRIWNCDSAELILQNHTQNVPGFLFNTGNGRTIFKRGAQSLGGGNYVFGADTLQVGTPNAWVQGGNSFGSTGILGTLDNNPLDFYSSGSQRMRLAPSGHLLIGTTTDNLYTMQLNGSFYNNGFFTNSPDLLGANIGGSGAIRLRWGSGDGSFIGFYNSANTNLRGSIASAADSRTLQVRDSVGISINTPYIVLGAEYGLGGKVSVINSGSLADLTVGRETTDSVIYDLVVGNNGFVGIGTLTPSAQLCTTGSVRFAGLTQDSTKINVLVSDAIGNLYYRSASSLAADNLVRSALTVNGTIKSKKIIISPDEWADYVFDSTYRLPTLGEVESYIHRERHLPGIPSAAEVQKDSLDVGAGQAALLKKIEELTLYSIEQAKRLDEQDNDIRQLKTRLEEMEKFIDQKKN